MDQVDYPDIHHWADLHLNALERLMAHPAG
jgi:hypothetical protein